ncbi:MAG: tRNA pseudouridine(38-40) synthase TruA [Acidobacteria bacterium]|nr:tRNA pseudouridine(38-40) synthase TruA [Acidobacteriota bacterium]
MPDVRRIRCRTAYDGTTFHGWQVQPGLPTIQAELQRVMSEIEEAPVTVEASGRTDAGVHALRQMIAFSIRNPIPCDNLRRAMNRLLPHSIRVFEVEETHGAFHPRFDAESKHYQYRIWRDEICLPFDRPYVHHHPYPLDEAIMAEAARALEGAHDFTAFAASDEKDALGHSKVRKIFRSSINRDGPRLIYDVEGSGFMKHMVRNLIGAIVEVGKGNLAIGDFEALLTGSGKAGPTLPAQGLFLIDVRYE